MRAYDFIVVGAGSAGAVVGRRLAEAKDASVLVLEAGGTEIPESSVNPSTWFMLLGSDIDWGYATVPQPGLNGRRTYEPRGKVIGGTGQMYIMMHIRGHPWDYDNWDYNGCPGWNYEQVLPYFKMLEKQEDNTSPWAGHDGLLSVLNAGKNDYHPLSPVFIEACMELGHPYTEDFNGPEMIGTGWHHINVTKEADGSYTRSSPAVTYLGPSLEWENVTLESKAQATRLLFDGKRQRAVGVEYVQDGQLQKVFANSEIVVCNGALESPHLLLNSGIGPAAQLNEFGKPVIVDLPGVGENFHNHVLTGLIAETKDPVAPGQMNTSEAAMFCTSDPGYHVPDLQFNFVHLPFDIIVGQENPNSVSLIPGLQRPLSRGWIRLGSSDPLEKPLINPNYLAVDADVQRMKQMIEIGREIFATKAFSEVLTGKELLPGPDYETDDELTRVRARARRFVPSPGRLVQDGARRDGSGRSGITRIRRGRAACGRRQHHAHHRDWQHSRRYHDDRREMRRHGEENARPLGVRTMPVREDGSQSESQVLRFRFVFRGGVMTTNPSSPRTVAEALIVAENEHNILGAVALFADGAVVQSSMDTFTTPDEIRGWQEELATNHLEIVPGSIDVEGDSARWRGTIALDPFRSLGLETLEGNWEIRVKEGMITDFSFGLSSDSLSRLQSAMKQD